MAYLLTFSAAGGIPVWETLLFYRFRASIGVQCGLGEQHAFYLLTRWKVSELFKVFLKYHLCYRSNLIAEDC